MGCEVALESGVVCGTHWNARGHYVVYGGEDDVMPGVVQAWYGLRTPLGECKDGSIAYGCAHGVPFDELAAMIEGEPAGLFVD